MVRNTDVRDLIKKAELFYWEIAQELNISDTTFSKKLRKEFTKEEKERLIEVIEKLKTERTRG